MGQRGWMTRHPLLTALVVLLLVLGGAGAFGDGDGTGVDPPAAVVPDDARSKPAEADEPQDAGAPGARPRRRPPPQPQPDRLPEPERRRTFLVTHVVDGDTLDLANGERVRLIGIDTPERGQCGYDESGARLSELVLGRRVRLVRPAEDRDAYGRMLRYVDVGKRDAGLVLLREEYAVARYDSRDGYGFHPREPRYIRADAGSPDRGCDQPRPRALLDAPAGGGCARGYRPCVPAYPPDLDCADVDGPIRVSGRDPHRLDGDGDGVACE